MARYLGPKCKLCRREGTKLYLKGVRCMDKDRCPVDKGRPIPGMHGRIKRKQSDYAIQLREKQKVKRIYGVLERQFRNTFHRAVRMKGITGENLLSLLERRLDNTVYRLGFASSRSEARQFVLHKHFLVNGRVVDRPSFTVKVGDEIRLREKSRKIARFARNLEEKRPLPSWLELDPENFTGKVVSNPQRRDITIPIQESLVVELYSK